MADMFWNELDDHFLGLFVLFNSLVLEKDIMSLRTYLSLEGFEPVFHGGLKRRSQVTDPGFALA
jgi:hypothetical protein